MKNKYKVIALMGQSGSGKAQPNTTLIPTPQGWKQLQDIQINDFVFDRLGQPTKVLNKFPQGEQEVYKVIFSDGRSALCCKEHIWSCYTSKNNLKNFTISEMLNSGIYTKTGNKRFCIPINQPVQYSKKKYAIPPYVIGAFLGDGCCTERALTLSSSDIEIVERIAQLTATTPKQYSPNQKSYSWKFQNSDGHNLQTKQYFQELPELLTTCDKKRIPLIYFYGDIEQRYELLQGLMDTDGHIDNSEKGRTSYTSINIDLIKDIQELCWSLGLLTTISEDNRVEKYSVGKCYHLTISGPNGYKTKLFSLPRKKNIALSYEGNNKIKKPRKKLYINEIQKLDYSTPMSCLLVDNKEHLYLTEQYIVTHNTTILNELIEGNYINGATPIISCTTRPIREGEQDGVNYHYLTVEEFTNQILNNEMIEATVFNNWCYGTSIKNLNPNTINIGVYNPSGIEIIQADPNIDLTVFYIQCDDRERLLRQLLREDNPNCDEIVRRYGTDKQDFSDDKIKDIQIDYIIQNNHNDDLCQICSNIANIISFGQNEIIQSK